MRKYLIIDGYNAINKIKELESIKDISLEKARFSFISILKNFMACKNMFDNIVIVFDSKEQFLGIQRECHGKVEVFFSTADRDADSVIVDMLRDASSDDNITVASDDNFVRNHARVFSREVISIRELKEIIMLKKQNNKSKMKTNKISHDKIKNINEELKKFWRLE
jgi:predicted RNA-binding protein with PIN domain